MPELDHTVAPIVDSYATALLSLSEAAGASDQVWEELSGVARLMDTDAGFGRFMTAPSVDIEERARSLEKLRGRIGDLVLNALQVINRKDRCVLIPLIAERYRLVLEEVRSEVDVHVTSAVELSEPLRTRLREVAQRVAGRTPRLVEKVDPRILGGLVVQVNDQKMDGSLSRHLQQLRALLLDRAAHEIHSRGPQLGPAETA